MNVLELSKHLDVSRRTVYNYRSLVDAYIARSSFRRLGRVQILIAQYLPLYEKLATGHALEGQFSSQTTIVNPLEYAKSVQSTPIDAEIVSDDSSDGYDQKDAGFIVRAEILDTPDIPGMPAIVSIHTDLSRVDQYCYGMTSQAVALESAILTHASGDAENLKAKLKGIYKTKMSEAKNEALRESLE